METTGAIIAHARLWVRSKVSKCNGCPGLQGICTLWAKNPGENRSVGVSPVSWIYSCPHLVIGVCVTSTGGHSCATKWSLSSVCKDVLACICMLPWMVLPSRQIWY